MLPLVVPLPVCLCLTALPNVSAGVGQHTLEVLFIQIPSEHLCFAGMRVLHGRLHGTWQRRTGNQKASTSSRLLQEDPKGWGGQCNSMPRLQEHITLL